MKHLHHHKRCILFLFLCVRWATEAEAAANASEPVDLVEAVNRSCMSMVLHEYYSDPSRRPKTNGTPCDSQSRTKDAASSGVFWLQGSAVADTSNQFFHKVLKIGVPQKHGFKEFSTVKRFEDGRVDVTGFPVQVFKSVMALLPYKVSYEFLEYEGDANHPSYYDSLISEVFYKGYDAVVGDTAMTANRSDYVDFTYEFMEAGVSMIVPVQDDDTSSPWWFLEPLTTELWLTTFAFSVLKGILVWFFEHEENEEFQGSTSQVVGKVLYFSSSIFLFANSEKLKKNYSRFVINIWMFLVFILVTSYGANLTSMLTVERLQPAIKDINQLKMNGDNVGCQNGSFVFELLKKMGFDDSKIKLYGTVEEYADALSKGNKNNGVAAIVDEIPYIKVFLNHHCPRYTRSQWTHRTGGFGFVFPRGSALVPDISRALLNFSRSEAMLEIEKKWFGDLTICPDSDAPVDNKRLPLYSLRSIFIIAGAASSLAFFIYLIQYSCKNKIFGLCQPILALGQWSTHRSQITPQSETEVEFNTTDSFLIEMTENNGKEEDQHAKVKNKKEVQKLFLHRHFTV